MKRNVKWNEEAKQGWGLEFADEFMSAILNETIVSYNCREGCERRLFDALRSKSTIWFKKRHPVVLKRLWL